MHKLILITRFKALWEISWKKTGRVAVSTKQCTVGGWLMTAHHQNLLYNGSSGGGWLVIHFTPPPSPENQSDHKFVETLFSLCMFGKYRTCLWSYKNCLWITLYM